MASSTTNKNISASVQKITGSEDGFTVVKMLLFLFNLFSLRLEIQVVEVERWTKGKSMTKYLPKEINDIVHEYASPCMKDLSRDKLLGLIATIKPGDDLSGLKFEFQC